MIKVALDEGVPEQIARHLPGYEVHSVGQLGLKGTKNGRLLDALEAAQFEAFITNDKRMQHEQDLLRRPFAIVLLSTNHWPTIKPHVGRIVVALSQAQPGVIRRVNCGNFVRSRSRSSLGSETRS